MYSTMLSIVSTSLVHLKAISKDNFVKVIWIPGLEGHVENEKQILQDRELKTQQTDIKQIIKSRLETWRTDSATKEWAR